MPEITLDQDHKYTVDKQRVPGFSEIIKDLGIGGNPFWTDAGRDEGTAIHKWCIFLASGNVPAEKPDPRIAGRLIGFQKFLDDSGFEFLDGEKALFHSIFNFAGMPDLWGHLAGTTCVIDVKRGAKLKIHELQTAAYKMLLRSNGFNATRRYGLYLKDGDYRLERHDGAHDESNWLKLVNAYHIKKMYGG